MTRSVASRHIVATDFNPLEIETKISRRTVGSVHIKGAIRKLRHNMYRVYDTHYY